ncbi:crotonase/enoyl-CoA hydratase family protein [Pseudomonas massiliensis]|uniref:crotonase/enoyl-CoA hydratase family protein n=1 Tax=Pseudomonas massiliensis TaxID=522492 RepID=UPI0005911C68|nr:crotonase/enoyl-CoA hydratase family protein [Pseudomonas massiliensis]
MSSYSAFLMERRGSVAHVQINRPEKRNAMNAAFWLEVQALFTELDADESVRAIVLSGAGAHFSAGIDLAMLAQVASELGPDVGRNARLLRRKILALQEALSCIERCAKPVLVAVQGYCIGGAVDLIATCDMRYCSADARFSIKEVDMGMAADVGTLQRLPRLIGDGLLRELAYTGREVDATEALRVGLVNRVFDSPEALLEGVFELATQIADKSPLAVSGTKRMLGYMRDHSVADGLEYIATWNAAMLQAPDLRIALAAAMSKQTPRFED